MKNRKRKIIAGFEMFLLISMSFAIAFLFSEEVGVVNADISTTPLPAENLPDNIFGADGKIYARFEGSYVETGTWDASSLGSDGVKDIVPKAPQTDGTGTGISGLFSGNAFGTSGVSGAISAITSGLIWGAIVGGGAYLLAGLFGLDKNQAASVGLAAGGGTFAGTTTYFIMNNMQMANPGLWGLGIGLGAGIGILLLTYKNKKQELIKFECLPWEPPLGGGDCEKCNKESMPCSEYRCKSLGQACDIVNKGTENEMCVWVGKGDVQAPKITPWEEALKPEGLSYIPDNAVSPPNRGFKIVKPQGKGCLEAFTKLQFGILTDEPAQCKIDLEPKGNYDEMQYLFGDTNIFAYEHTELLPGVNPFTEEGNANAPQVNNDGTYTLYVRCMDANGNGKDSAFVAFKYCVNAGPDTMAPKIVGTSIVNGKAVRFDVDKVPIEVYTNEPAVCKWSHEDQAYNSMPNTMECSKESYQFNSNLDYACKGELNGIKNQQNNDFYFRCKDFSTAPGGRNVMTTSEKLTLRGTEKLTISNPGPSGVIQGGETTIGVELLVETGHGADEGKSICYIDTKTDGEFTIAMDTEPKVKHSQTLYLGEGNYEYFFRCFDSGVNMAETSTSFEIKIDKAEPLIARVFKDGDSLKIITNEEAKCSYSLTSCDYDFEEATETVFSYEDPTKKVVHYVAWNPTVTYYIKCADFQNRKPAPDACSITVKGSEL